MAKPKRLLRGLDNFADLIQRNGYFVDKSLLIKELLDNAHSVVLLPRPRRFGKSLNLSMLNSYFSINEKNQKELFEQLKIAEEVEIFEQHAGKYPVIQVALKNINGSNFLDCIAEISGVLAKLYRNYSYLLNSDRIDEFEKHDFRRIAQRETDVSILAEGLQLLSSILYKHHNQKVWILIDEYDSPIHLAFQYGFYPEMIRFMKTFLGGALKTNNALFKGVLTGILRVSKESIFSDLNNVGIYTIMNQPFADKFGFTEAETRKILAQFNLSEHFPDIKNWYNGYRIGNEIGIYNPWSISGFVAHPEEGFKTYWVNTSADELIKNRIYESGADAVRDSIETLLSDQSITKTIEENIVFSDFSSNRELFWSLLLFAGYLTPTKHINNTFFEIAIPNLEIKILFQRIILGWLSQYVNVSSALLLEMTRSLTSNRMDDFEKQFRKIMGDTMSYYDVDKEPEAVWQAYILGLLAILNDDYLLKSNRESGQGRYDILLLPKRKDLYGIIFEIKSIAKKATKKRIQTQLRTALNQIHNNEYYRELETHNIQKRIEIALVFAGKKMSMLTNAGD